MKKLLCILLSTVLLVCICGCSTSDNSYSSEIIEVIYEEETVYEGDNTVSDTTDKTVSSTSDTSSKENTGSIVHTSQPDTSTESQENTFYLNDDKVLEKIKLNGRTQKTDEGIVLDFAASAIEFNTDSSSVMLEVNAESGVYYSVLVDDKPEIERGITEQGVNYINLVRGLGAGQHNIKFIRATEGRSGNSMTAVNIQLDEGKSLVASTKNESGVLIEFLGDSMSSGYGNLVHNGASNASDLKYQDSLKAYPYLVASKLGFDYRIVSLSAIALKERTINNVTYPAFYDFYKLENYYKDKNQSYTSSNPQDVDIVVLNLGTNDVANGTLDNEDSSKVEEYAGIYTDLITKIGYNKDAKIVFLSGIMWCHEQTPAYNSAKLKLNELGYNNVYLYDLPSYQSGGGGHPSADEHQKVADALIKFFKDNGIA